MDLSGELDQSLCGAPIIRIVNPPFFGSKKIPWAGVIATGVVTFPLCFPAPKSVFSNEMRA